MITASGDERDIYRAIVRFARAMDERDWDAIRRIALPDATADLGSGELQGSDGMIALMRGYLEACGPTQHMVGNVLIDVDADRGTAESRAYVSDMHLAAGGDGRYFRTLGDYHDSWARVDGEWRMTRRVKRVSGTLGTQAVFAGAGANAATPDTDPVSAITALLYRYAECIDAGRLADAAELFRHASVRVGADELVDADGLLAIWRSSIRIHEDGTPRTKHVITNPIVEVDAAAGTARSRSYYTVVQATLNVPLQIIASGRYHDEFELADGQWRFRFRDYTLFDFPGNLGDHMRGGS